MTKPVTIPTTFATSNGGNTPVSLLDANFTALSGAVNDLGTYANYTTDTGSANAYVITYPNGITVALVNGLPISFRAANTNTLGSTVNVQYTVGTTVTSLGIVTLLRPDGTATQAGDVQAGRIVSATYDLAANAFYLNTLGAIPSGSAGSVIFQNTGTGSVPRTVQAKLQEAQFSVKDFGATGNGVTDDTASIQAAENAAALVGAKLWFPPGTYSINATGITKTQNVDWIGAEYGSTIIKARALTYVTGLVNATGISSFRIANFTFDCSLATSFPVGMINFNSNNDYTIENCQFTGNFTFAIAHNAGNRAIFRNNIFVRTTASNAQNQGLLISTSAGICQDCLIEYNYHQNTGMDLSCQYSTIRDNQVFNWQFGAGITIEQNNSCSDLKITNNTCNGGSGTDVNATVCLGIENWAPRTQIIGNTCANNAGDGISNGGQNCTIVGNTCLNNGQISGNGITSRYSSVSVNGNYSTIVGNTCIDTQGSHTQNYGYADFNSNVFGVFLAGNTFSGNLTGAANIQGTVSFATPTFQAVGSFAAGTLTNGSSAGGAFTCNGAAFGDAVYCGFSGNLQGVKLFAYVSAANQVSFRFENNTGGSITLGTNQVTLIVSKAINYAQY